MALALFLVGLLFFAAVVFSFIKCVPLVRPALYGKLFDTVWGYRPGVISQLHGDYAAPTVAAEQRRAIYLQEVRWDNAFALAYTFCLLCWLAAEASAWGGEEGLKSLNLFTVGMGLALLGGASDLIENRLIAVILEKPQGPLPRSLVGGLSAATNAKWLAGAAAILLLIIGFASHGGH